MNLPTCCRCDGRLVDDGCDVCPRCYLATMYREIDTARQHDRIRDAVERAARERTEREPGRGK